MGNLPAGTQSYADSLAAQMLSGGAGADATPVQQTEGVTIEVGQVTGGEPIAPVVELFNATTLGPSTAAWMEALEEYREYLVKFADAEKDNIAGASAAALNYLLGDIAGGPYSALMAAVALAVLPRELSKLRELASKPEDENRISVVD